MEAHAADQSPPPSPAPTSAVRARKIAGARRSRKHNPNPTPPEETPSPSRSTSPTPDPATSDNARTPDTDPSSSLEDIFTESILIGPLVVTFDQQEELIRGQSNVLPEFVYRVYHEWVATLSHYVVKDSHVAHPEKPRLRLKDGNAFQAISDFYPLQDITPERFARHFVTQQKKAPSSVISTFKTFKKAYTYIKRMSDKSKKVPRRCAMAKIRLAGLKPATLRCQMRTKTFKRAPNVLIDELIDTTIKTVEVPFWVRDTPGLTDKVSVTFEQIQRSGADFWFSVAELSISDLRVAASVRHQDEWLAGGHIPRSHVPLVMPYDGAVLHTKRTSEVVRSRLSVETFLFNWTTWMWLHNPDTTVITNYRDENDEDRRKRANDEVEPILAIFRGILVHMRNNRARRDAPVPATPPP